jgi:hypothetical protein
MTIITTMTLMISLTPKAAAKHDLLFNKPEAGLLNKSSSLDPALGVTKFIIVRDMVLVTHCCDT